MVFFGIQGNCNKICPVLKIDAHGAHVRRTKESWEDQKASWCTNNHAIGGWRTKDILGGPKSLDSKNLAAQRAERTKVLRKQTTGRTKNYLTNRWDTEKLNISLKTETKTGIVYFDT